MSEDPQAGHQERERERRGRGGKVNHKFSFFPETMSVIFFFSQIYYNLHHSFVSSKFTRLLYCPSFSVFLLLLSLCSFNTIVSKTNEGNSTPNVQISHASCPFPHRYMFFVCLFFNKKTRVQSDRRNSVAHLLHFPDAIFWHSAKICHLNLFQRETMIHLTKR